MANRMPEADQKNDRVKEIRFPSDDIEKKLDLLIREHGARPTPSGSRPEQCGGLPPFFPDGRRFVPLRKMRGVLESAGKPSHSKGRGCCFGSRPSAKPALPVRPASHPPECVP